ncbi:MAG: ParB/RepB/Spo0J family partition protein [Acidobacteriota bacterium]
MSRKALGRGLSALFSDSSKPGSDTIASEPTGEITGEELLEVDIDYIEPNPEQPRTHFDPAKLVELSQSIRANGVVQPILVRRLASGRYQLIAGERRWRAAQLAGLKRMQAIVRDVPDANLLAVALIENIQRAELNAIEEANAYQRLMDTFGATQEQLSSQVGKDRSSIANYLRLLRLPANIQQMIEEDALSMGHARALLGLESPELQTKLAGEIVRRKLSVRQAESAVKQLSQKRAATDSSTLITNDANIRAAELKLKRLLGTQVRIRSSRTSDRTAGSIDIAFGSLADLDRIYSIIMRKTDLGSSPPNID